MAVSADFTSQVIDLSAPFKHPRNDAQLQREELSRSAKVYRFAFLLVAAGISISGCSTNGPSKNIPEERLISFETIDELIQEEFRSPYSVRVSNREFFAVSRPFAETREYCNLQGGRFSQIDSYASPSIVRDPYYDRPSQRHNKEREDRRIAEFQSSDGRLFGVFFCLFDDKRPWGVRIENRPLSSFEGGGGGFYEFSVTPIDHNGVSARLEMDDEKRLERERAVELRRQEKRREKEELEELMSEERERQRKTRDKLIAQAIEFRTTVKLGTETHCGMIIQLRDTLAEVQTSSGNYWLRIDQLYPPNVVDCRFLNGVYVEPF